MRKLLSIISAVLFAGFALTSCETPAETALLGAGIGALSGHHTLRNAAIGAGAGYLAGRILEDHRRDDYYYDDAYPRRRYYREREVYGRPTERRGFVISPYSGNVIDVRGFPHGARVIDPSVDRVFVNP